MTNNIRFRITTYIQLLKYIEDIKRRELIIAEVMELLDLLSINGPNKYKISDDLLVEDLHPFYNSSLRKAINEMCEDEKCLNIPLSSKDILSWAMEHKITIKETLMEIGKFLQEYKGLFATEDNIYITTINRGTGSNQYKFNKIDEIRADGDANG